MAAPIPTLRPTVGAAVRLASERLWPGLIGLITGLLLSAPLLAAEQRPIPLECRLGQGPWRPCTMEIRSIGVEWQLLIGGRRISFRHDQRGSMRMLEPGSSSWREVDSRWIEPSSLCWDGVCARGDIPLD